VLPPLLSLQESEGDCWTATGTHSSTSKNNNAASSMQKSKALEAAFRALLPWPTVEQLSDLMAPSQPAAVKAAAARELAHRLNTDTATWEYLQYVLSAFQAERQGVSRLAQMLIEPNDCDTQLAALGLLKALWELGTSELALRLLEQPGVEVNLVRLLHEGDALAVRQAAAADALERLLLDHGYDVTTSLPQPLAPSQSDPNSWPVVSGLVAVLRAAAVSAEGKEAAVWALFHLMLASTGDRYSPPRGSSVVQRHPAVQAAVAPLVALLQHEDVQGAAATALGTLADGCRVNQCLIGAVDGAISRMWQLVKQPCDDSPASCMLAAVIAGHSDNQSCLMNQKGFMDDLVGLLPERDERFLKVATALIKDNPEFVLRLCNIPAAVPALTASLNPKYYSTEQIQCTMALLLSMAKAQPITIHTISMQPGWKFFLGTGAASLLTGTGAAPALAFKDFFSWPVFLVVVLSKSPQLCSFRPSSAMQHAAWRELPNIRGV
jgi:hypothetical protein